MLESIDPLHSLKSNQMGGVAMFKMCISNPVQGKIMNVVEIIFGTNSIPQKVIFPLFPSTLTYTHPGVLRQLYDSLLHLTCPSHEDL